MYRLLFFIFAISSPVMAQVSIGPGCTTAYFIDKDCDGHGVGVKSSGTYTLGINGESIGNPLIETSGDMPDADDEDPTVQTTAQWQAKWGSNNAAIVNFLSTRRGFTAGRVYYLALTGNDSTGVVNDPAHPYRTMAPLLSIFHDLQGGAIIIRGGTWTDMDFGPCSSGNNPCYSLSGSSTNRVYVMSYPGELVKLIGGTHIIWNDLNYWPQKNARYVTYDGLVLAAANYGSGDGVSFIDTDHMTLINSEFLGWHQLFFGNHTEDLTVKSNVFHQMMYHCVYAGSFGLLSNGAADFDFTADAAAYTAGTSVGATYRVTVQSNVMYNNGDSGYEPIHINVISTGNLVDSNVISYSGGTGINFQTGVYHSTISNNAIFDNGRCGITLSLYGSTDTNAATERWNTIVNNTIWSTLHSESIRNTNPGCGIVFNDYTTVTGHWIKDTLVRNNVFVTNESTNAPISFMRNSFPDTQTFDHNVIYNPTNGGSPSNLVVTISSDAFPDGHGAGNYNFAQFQAFSSRFTGNAYADPKLSATNTSYAGTPGKFDLSLTAGSPAVAAGSATGGPATDIRAIPRSGHVDIGAYQFVNSPCDRNGDGIVDGKDVSLMIAQAIGQMPCTSGIRGGVACDVTDVVGVIFAVLTGVCPVK